MRILITSFLVLSLTSCSYFRSVPKVTIDGGGLLSRIEANGPKDAGTPTTVDSGVQEKSMKIPAGSVIVETKTEAVPATQSTPYVPAKTTREIKLVSDTTWFDRAQDIRASTGTIDTSVAKHRIDIESRKPMLYGGLAAIVLAIVSKIWIPQWPIIPHTCYVVGGILLAAWKFAEVPWWASCIVGGLALAVVLGYKRAEWDKNNDGIPDILQKKV